MTDRSSHGLRTGLVVAFALVASVGLVRSSDAATGSSVPGGDPRAQALLATLAIVVWHFYSIIFDPDVYPLNTAFLTGKTVKKPASSTEHQKPPAPAVGD